MEPIDVDATLQSLQEDNRKVFDRQDQLRSFRDYLADFFRQPYVYLRTAPQYILEMFDFYGTSPAEGVEPGLKRFRVFDPEVAGETASFLVGQERPQLEMYNFISSFARRGRVDKMVLLHGPSGSGKTTFIECMVKALETFSGTPQGSLLRFNWVFTEREGKLDRIGFDSSEGEGGESDSLALLDEKDISFKIPCEMNDPPIFLVPRELRQKLIEKAIQGCDQPARPDFNYSYFVDGDLCQKCRKIYDALLFATRGDWRRVVRHAQVERYYISKRYRAGAVAIEPQGNIDATVRPIHSERSWSLPAFLRNVTLYEPVGDIIDANHGILEYSDFLKRPLEANKYLLTTCERGTVNLPQFMAYLNLLIVGTTNEKHLSLFKRNPDFSSFKGRIQLISMPYLRAISKETRLYKNHIQFFSRDRHVTPHTAEIAATFAVLTRLRKCNPENYSGILSTVVGRLTPLEKALLYDLGEPPIRFKEEEQKALRGNIDKIYQEFEENEGEFEGIFGAEYEGRRGASAREMMTTLSLAAENRNYHCLTPMAVFDALEELCKDTSLYVFLRLPVEDGYHDFQKFIHDVRDEYIKNVTHEVYESIGLIDESEYNRYFLEYFRHVKAYKSKEKLYSAATNTYESPNLEQMNSVESIAGISESPEVFRSNIMTRIAAWYLDHPQEKIDYHKLFPSILAALRENFYRERNRMLTLIEQDILKFGSEDFPHLNPADQERVRSVLTRMGTKYQYCLHCAKDVIAFVLRNRG